MRAFLACCAGIAKPASSCKSGSMLSVIGDHAQTSTPSGSRRKRLAIMIIAAGADAARQRVVLIMPKPRKQSMAGA